MTESRKATPEEVLEELRVFGRDYLGFSSEVVRQKMTHETSFDDFNKLVGDDFDWIHLIRHLGISIPEHFGQSWKSISTLGDLCIFLAAQIEIPSINSVSILGKPCASAGLFLDLKRQLIESGESESKIAPSTPIAPYLARQKDLFAKIRWYAPGKLPLLRVRNRPLEWGCLSLLGINFFGLIYGFFQKQLFPDLPPITSWAVGLGVFSACLIAFGILFRRDVERATLEGLTDFRSLVDALLDRPSTRKPKLQINRMPK
jgi:hypothetical protein